MSLGLGHRATGSTTALWQSCFSRLHRAIAYATYPSAGRLAEAHLGEPVPCHADQLLKTTSWADAANAVALGWCKFAIDGAARVLARHRLPSAEDECESGEE